MSDFSQQRPDPAYQRQWRIALHAILLLLAKRAEQGGLPRSEIYEVLGAERRIPQIVTKDALSYLERQGLISEERFQGELGDDYHQALLPAALPILAGARHEIIAFQVTASGLTPGVARG